MLPEITSFCSKYFSKLWYLFLLIWQPEFHLVHVGFDSCGVCDWSPGILDAVVSIQGWTPPWHCLSMPWGAMQFLQQVRCASFWKAVENVCKNTMYFLIPMVARGFLSNKRLGLGCEQLWTRYKVLVLKEIAEECCEFIVLDSYCKWAGALFLKVHLPGEMLLVLQKKAVYTVASQSVGKGLANGKEGPSLRPPLTS